MMTLKELEAVREAMWTFRDALNGATRKKYDEGWFSLLYYSDKSRDSWLESLRQKIEMITTEIEDRKLGQKPEPDAPPVYLTAQEAKVALSHIDALHGDKEPDDGDKAVIAKLTQIIAGKR